MTAESGHKEGEPDIVGTFSVNRDENLTVMANRGDIEDRCSLIIGIYDIL